MDADRCQACVSCSAIPYSKSTLGSWKCEDRPTPNNILHEHELLRLFAFSGGCLQRTYPVPSLQAEPLDNSQNFLRTAQKTIVNDSQGPSTNPVRIDSGNVPIHCHLHWIRLNAIGFDRKSEHCIDFLSNPMALR